MGCRSKLDKSKLKLGTRVALDMTTFTIMRMLPREVDPMVYSMGMEDPGQISFAGIGGLSDQIRELREVKHGFKSVDRECTAEWCNALKDLPSMN